MLNGDNMKILLVDDTEMALTAASMLIKAIDKNHEIQTASRAKAALELLEKTSFDLIISDLRMPEMSGLDFAKNITLKEKNCMLYICSSETPSEKELSDINLHSNGFFSKPLDLKALNTLFSDMNVNSWNKEQG